MLFKDKQPVDGLGDIFGFRTFEARGHNLYLNGEEVFLRSINRHDEFFHGPDMDAGRVGDEEYQELVLKFQFRHLLNQERIVCVSPWIFADFKTKSDKGTCQFTPHLNRKGLVCADRTRKRAYTLVQNVYRSLARNAGEGIE